MGNAARLGARRSAYRILVGRNDGKRPLGRPRRIEAKILKWIFKTWDREAWTGLLWLTIGTGGGHL